MIKLILIWGALASAFAFGYIARGIVLRYQEQRAVDQQFGSLRIAAKQLEDRRAKGPC